MAEVVRSTNGKQLSHATTTFGPRTLCGCVVTATWITESVRYVEEATVECRRCRASLEIIAKAESK